MSLAALMYADQTCVKERTQTINCVGTIFNNSSSQVTLTDFIVNVGTTGAPVSRNIPIAPPYFNNVIPANGSITVSWGESVVNSTPPASASAPSLQVAIGFTARASDGSSVASLNAVISCYANQPPSVGSPFPAVPAGATGAPFGFISSMPVFQDPKAVAPVLPQNGQFWLESGFNSGMVPLLVP